MARARPADPTAPDQEVRRREPPRLVPLHAASQSRRRPPDLAVRPPRLRVAAVNGGEPPPGVLFAIALTALIASICALGAPAAAWPIRWSAA